MQEKVESASPKVCVESVVLIVSEYHEGRDAAVNDVPGACLNATIDKFILLKMVHTQAYVVCGIDKNT